MIELNWDPVPHWGPIPINWYGITWILGFLAGSLLIWRWAPKFDVPREKIEGLITWIMVGTLIGARLYFVVQNHLGAYLSEPWRILAVWEGGLAYFGGLFGGILAGFLYTRREGLPPWRVADLLAPAIPIGSAIGRISCGLAGMDYGTPTSLPWEIVYTHPNSYAPSDGVARHPDQFYELLGDLLIAGILLKLRGKLPHGGLFLIYLILFSLLRFFIFFVRGNVDPVALGLKNAQWTALAMPWRAARRKGGAGFPTRSAEAWGWPAAGGCRCSPPWEQTSMRTTKTPRIKDWTHAIMDRDIALSFQAVGLQRQRERHKVPLFPL